MWMTRIETKGKRILAVLLMVCMTVQLAGWDLGSFQAIAEENGRKPIGKTITVSEKEILKAVKAGVGESQEINENILPYTDPQNEMARDHLESILSQAVIVKQKDLGGKCSAIVAVELSEDSEAVLEPTGSDAFNESDDAGRMFGYENILMIGLNGNRDRDCEFTLEITNAEGIVVKEMTMTGYRQDWELATDSNALATSSNAAPARIRVKTLTSSNSNADAPEEEDEEGMSYLFVKDYTKTMGVEQSEIPKMSARAGGFSVTELRNVVKESAVGKIADVGVYVNEDIWNEEEACAQVQTGELFAVYAKASYSAVNSSNIENAFFAVQFTISPDRKELVKGPEAGGNAVPVEALTGDEAEEWEKIRELLDGNPNYESYREEDQWQRITVESFTFYYSPNVMLAVFNLQNKGGQSGSSISGVPFRFRFQNGITPDEARLTAAPGVLNQKELEEDYTEHNGGAGAEGKIEAGEPLDVEGLADFQWNNVSKTAEGLLDDGTLGNLNQNVTGNEALDGEIKYAISASPKYGSDKTKGVMYTKAYTIFDRMMFENFYIDCTKHTIIDGTEQTEKPQRGGELYLKEKGTDKLVKLISLDLPAEVMEKGVAKPVYDPLDKSKVVGIEMEFTVENATLDGDSPEDLKILSKSNNENLGIRFNVGGLRIGGLLKFEEDAESLPKVVNRVNLDTYSIMYEGDDYPSSDKDENSVDKRRHHSRAQVEAEAAADYKIIKKAYQDEECQTEAIGEKQVFGPNSYVYYQITVTNSGYNSNQFRVTDVIPAGIAFESVTLKSLRIGGTDAASLPETEKDKIGSALTWDKIEIPAGQSAVLVLGGRIKLKEEFDDENISTSLENTARWYVSGDGGRLLGESKAAVFVKLDALAASEIQFSKVSETTGEVAIGETVSYHLTAQLTDATKAPQRLTITDKWPSQLTLMTIESIPADAVVTLKKDDGTTLGEYSSGKDNTTAKVPGSFSLNGKRMTQEQVVEIGKVEINLLVDGKAPKQIILSGKVNSGGEIRNDASIGGEGVNKPAPPVINISLAMKIQKKAYRIKAQNSGSITEDNSLSTPVDERVTFAKDDVVCYEVQVTNTGAEGKDDIAPVIMDHISEIFGLSSLPEPAEATLQGKTGYVFHRRGDGNWKVLTAPDGKITLDLKDSPLPAGQTETIRIYLKVPDDAVGAVPKECRNTARAELKIGEKTYGIEASASITTLNTLGQKATIEKEVLAVAEDFLPAAGSNSYLLNAKWNTPEVFGSEGGGFKPEEKPLKVGTGDYVFYRVKIHNESETPLRIYEVEDWLQEGMKAKAFYEFGSGIKTSKTWGKVDESGRMDLGPWGWSPTLLMGFPWQTKLYDGTEPKEELGIGYAGNVRHDPPHARLLEESRIYRTRVYGGDTKGENKEEALKKIAVIKPKGTVVFGIIAQVTGSFEPGTPLTNTAGFITDSAVEKGSIGKGCTEEANPESLDGMDVEVGGKTYGSGDFKAFTASATVISADYTPGIEKALSQYFAAGEWNSYDPEYPSAYFAPTDRMRWRITLENGMNSFSTAGDIEEYTVSDTLPLGFVYNGESEEGNKFMPAGGSGISLPIPELSVNREGKTVVKWTVAKKDGSYIITGANPEKAVTTAQNLSIPKGGSISLQIETKTVGSTGLRYGTYINRADLVPAERYAYSTSCDGVVEGEEDGKTIYGTATVNIYGSGRTEAWKEITGTYAGKEASASGKLADNYVWSDAGETVRYGLKIQNKSDRDMGNLVLMDRLPSIGDNGLVNNSKRYSDFAVDFADEMNLEVSVDGVALASDAYRVYYARWSDLAGEGSALSDGQWKMTARDHWYKERVDGHDSIRIEIENKEALGLLGKDKTLTVSFNGVVPEAHELKNLDTAIAWNTFGYSYEIGGAAGTGSQFLTVEPAKVGVKIPTAELNIKKEVNSDLAGDNDREFSFILEKKEEGLLPAKWLPVEDQRYTIDGTSHYTGSSSGGTAGEFRLRKDQTASFTVLANSEYRVKELNADGFVVKVTPFTTTNDGKTVDYNEKQPPSIHAEMDVTYFCTFINTKNSLILPETGGMGTGGFHMAGESMILLAFLMILGYWFCEYFKVWKKEEDYNENV